MLVIKRNGKTEELNEDKINEVVENACYGLNVSPSTVALNASIQLFNGIESKDIQKALIKSASDLISVERPDYQYVAARLLMFDVRKSVFGQYEYPDFYDHVKENILLGKYDKEIYSKYTKDEIDELGLYLDSERDCSLAYAGAVQLVSKYLVQDRENGQLFEAPQQLYMLVAMCLFQEYEGTERLGYVKRFYDATSLGKISLPTPIMNGVRTPTRQFSSCTLIDCDDNLDSINATTSAIVKYASKRAGIGINGGKIRALGSSIRSGEALHTGVTGFYKYFQAALKSCSQGAARGASATLFFPFWHQEVESMLVLKNNKGVEDNRVRHLDYGFQVNRLFYKRYKEGRDITLFSPHVSEELYEYFFTDNDKFEALYEELESNPLIKRKTISASDLMNSFVQERASTGRVYLQNVDHCNVNSPFDIKQKNNVIKMLNLCLEIALPTTPLQDVRDGKGSDAEIALCTLAAFNVGNDDIFEELPELSDLTVRALDALLDYQDYPVEAAEKNKLRRTLGVGIIGYAHFLTKNDCKYSDGSGNNLTHKLMESIQYNLLTASNNLAKEKGACEWFNKTSYANGVLPVDRYKKEVDLYHSEPLHCDWEGLRKSIQEYGLRNSTLTALMPSECHLHSDKLKFTKDGITEEYSMRDFCTINGIDVALIEETGAPITIPLDMSFSVGKGNVVEGIHYNGVKTTYNIEMEDGIVYNLTGNHPVAVKTEDGYKWVTVDKLEGDEDIYEIHT